MVLVNFPFSVIFAATRAPAPQLSLKRTGPPSPTFTKAGCRFRQIPPSVGPPSATFANGGCRFRRLATASAIGSGGSCAGSGRKWRGWGGWQRSLETPLMQDEPGRLKKLKKESCTGTPVNLDVASSDFLVWNDGAGCFYSGHRFFHTGMPRHGHCCQQVLGWRLPKTSSMLDIGRTPG